MSTTATSDNSSSEYLGSDLLGGSPVLGRAWGRRALWQVHLRWWVPPAILVSLVASWWLGYRVEVVPILAVAGAILVYNIPFAVVAARVRAAAEGGPTADNLYAFLQVTLDYAAVFLLVHFTGGAGSPLLFFFLFHVVFAAILLRASTAYLFALVATGGMFVLAIAEYVGWVASHPLVFRGESLNVLDRPGHIVALLAFFSASVIIVAVAATRIMASLRQRVIWLAQTKNETVMLNERLGSIYDVLTALGSETDLGRVLDVVTSSLAAVMGVRAVSVKLLSEDRKTLRYVAVHGLPREFLDEQAVEVAQTPFNRRIIEGETLVSGQITPGSPWRLQATLAEIGIRSLLLAPLKVHRRVIGILCAYCDKPHRFGPEDASFFRLAAELVAIAIEHAKRHEAVQQLLDERLTFMSRVAHNMRAPLAASVSMLHLLGEGYLGEIVTRQAEHLKRVIRRLRSLDATVGEILALGRSRLPGTSVRREAVDLGQLAERAVGNFREQASERELALRLDIADGLPPVTGDPNLLEQVLENIVSNAIKYTPAGGDVHVTLAQGADGGVGVSVRDTGIGVPKEEQNRLFSEFFRASNAKKSGEAGTGLGLRIVQDVVLKHGGEVTVSSEEGRGTLVQVVFPRASVEGPPLPADETPAAGVSEPARDS